MNDEKTTLRLAQLFLTGEVLIDSDGDKVLLQEDGYIWSPDGQTWYENYGRLPDFRTCKEIPKVVETALTELEMMKAYLAKNPGHKFDLSVRDEDGVELFGSWYDGTGDGENDHETLVTFAIKNHGPRD